MNKKLGFELFRPSSQKIVKEIWKFQWKGRKSLWLTSSSWQPKIIEFETKWGLPPLSHFICCLDLCSFFILVLRLNSYDHYHQSQVTCLAIQDSVILWAFFNHSTTDVTTASRKETFFFFLFPCWILFKYFYFLLHIFNYVGRLLQNHLTGFLICLNFCKHSYTYTPPLFAEGGCWCDNLKCSPKQPVTLNDMGCACLSETEKKT